MGWLQDKMLYDWQQCNGWHVISFVFTTTGYGGVVTREAVKDGADWFIHDFQVFTLNLCQLFSA